jgi:hypothetical protein
MKKNGIKKHPLIQHQTHPTRAFQYGFNPANPLILIQTFVAYQKARTALTLNGWFFWSKV